MVEKCDVILDKLCQSIPDEEYRPHCHAVVQETAANIDNLRKTANRLSQLLRSKRQKRALDIIGGFSKWAFGTMDSEDARRVYQKLEFLHKRDQETFQVMDRQLSVMSSNFDKLSKPINQLAAEIDNITAGVESLSETFLDYSPTTNKEVSLLKMRSDVNILASSITAKVVEVQNKQTLELAVFDDLYQNKIHPFILNVENITDILKSATTKGFSFEDSFMIYQTSKTFVFPKGGNLYIKIVLPLPDTLHFEVYKVYPLPTNLEERWDLMIDTKYEYIAESDNHDLFVMLSQEQYSRCSHVPTGESTKNVAICRHETPVLTSGSNECLVELLQHAATSKVSCKYAAVPASEGLFLKMTAPNEWLFKVKDSLVLNLKCGSQQYTATINGSGILKMEQPCEASAKGFKLFYEHQSEVTTEYKQPMVDHSELTKAILASSNPVQAASMPKFLPIRIGNHKSFANELSAGKKTIEDLAQNWKLLNAERKTADQDWELSFHRYSIMSLSIFGAVAFFVMFSIRCLRSKARTILPTQNQPPTILTTHELTNRKTPRRRAPTTVPKADTAYFSVTSARV